MEAQSGIIWTRNKSSKGCKDKALNELPKFAFELPDNIVEGLVQRVANTLSQPEKPEDTEYDKTKRWIEEERGVVMIEKGLVYLVDDDFLNIKDLKGRFRTS